MASSRSVTSSRRQASISPACRGTSASSHESGFVSMRPDGQRRLYALKPEPFRELDEWLGQYRKLWEARLDRFEAALEKKQQARRAQERSKRK